MKLKYQFIIPLLFLVVLAQGQDQYTQEYNPTSPATRQGSSLISSILVYSNSNGQAFIGSSENRIQVLQVSTSYLNFIVDQFAFGGDFGVERISANNFSSTSLEIGPLMGYYFDNGSLTIPYINFGISYLYSKPDFNDQKDEGARIKLTGGILFRIEHFAFNLEAGYRHDDIDGGGNIISLGVGMSACLYPNEEE